jgi:hypothetical protein
MKKQLLLVALLSTGVMSLKAQEDITQIQIPIKYLKPIMEVYRDHIKELYQEILKSKGKISSNKLKDAMKNYGVVYFLTYGVADDPLSNIK